MSSEHQAAEAVARKTSLKWVERLLEPRASDALLLEAAEHLTRSQYPDVVEERGILGLCGWAGCGEELGPVPRQKYHISVQHKQVVDITERKKFCSSECYKASRFYCSQLSTVAGWAHQRRSGPVQLLSPTAKKLQMHSPDQQSVMKDHPSTQHTSHPPLPIVISEQPSPLHPPPAELPSSTCACSDQLATLSLTDQPLPTQPHKELPSALGADPDETEHRPLQRPKLSSVGRLLHALSSWSTPQTDRLLQRGEEGGEVVRETILPPAHSRTQTQLQRSILQQQIKKNLPSVVHPLGLSVQQTLPYLTALTDTFSLDRYSIVFRPSEWKVIILVLLLSCGEFAISHHPVVDQWLTAISASHTDLQLMLKTLNPTTHRLWT